MNIKTSFDYPPIPCRNLDWSAWDDDTFDASFEGSDETGDHWSSSPVGHGATEQEAIDDLLAQLDLPDLTEHIPGFEDPAGRLHEEIQ